MAVAVLAHRFDERFQRLDLPTIQEAALLQVLDALGILGIVEELIVKMKLSVLIQFYLRI